MRNTLSWSLGILVVLLAARPSIGAGPVHERPDTFGIDGITIQGDECPGGAATDVSTDREAFTVIFSNFLAQVDPTTHQAKAKCKVTLKMNVPAGWSYAVTSVDFRGFVSLEPGVTATKQTRYHMAAQGKDKTPERGPVFTWNGPFEEDFAVRDIGDLTEPYWSRCGKGKVFQISTDVTLTNPNGNAAASGFLALDSIDGQVFPVQWRHCP